MSNLSNRVLMAASLNELYLQQRIFVAVSSMFNNDSMIRLAVFIPGETEEMHSRMRDELCGYLLQNLTGISDDWAVEVKIAHDPHTNDDTVVVYINDAKFMMNESEQLVLDAVRVFMTVRARRMYRRLSILGAHQLLVPLNFEYQDMLRSMVRLQLPKGFNLRDTYGRTVKPSDHESFDQARKLLRETLMTVLRAKGIQWKYLHLMPTPAGLQLDVMFDGANSPKVYELNTFEATVAQLLNIFCRYPDTVYSQLVFEPVRRHDTELDDGSESPERYEEY